MSFVTREITTYEKLFITYESSWIVLEVSVGTTVLVTSFAFIDVATDAISSSTVSRGARAIKGTGVVTACLDDIFAVIGFFEALINVYAFTV